jgi:hypothetical protein
MNKMNKKQNGAIILSIIGGILFFGFHGASRPISDPINILVGVILIVVLTLLAFMIFTPVHCPKCGEKMPIRRTPQNESQKLYGGWTCPKCGTEMDSSGNIVSH